MKLQLNKLMAGLVMAGSVVALVGCGDGGSPTLGASSNVTTAIKAGDKVALAAAQTTTRALGEAGANFPLGTTVVFNTNVTNPTAGVPAIPANSTLNLNPSTNALAIGDFKISSASTTKTVEGIVLPGSCQFKVTGPSVASAMLEGFLLGNTYAITPCNLALQTTGVPVGDASVQVSTTLQLGSAPPIVAVDTITGAPRTVKVTVSSDGAVTAVVPAGVTIPVLNADGTPATETVNVPVLNDAGQPILENGVPVTQEVTRPRTTTTTTETTIPVAPAGSVSLTTGG